MNKLVELESITSKLKNRFMRRHVTLLVLVPTALK